MHFDLTSIYAARTNTVYTQSYICDPSSWVALRLDFARVENAFTDKRLAECGTSVADGLHGAVKGFSWQLLRPKMHGNYRPSGALGGAINYLSPMERKK
eukprot:IDg20588t1